MHHISFSAVVAVVALTIGVARSARADIILLDLNNNPKEVEAAKRGAQARGETVIVLSGHFSDSLNNAADISIDLNAKLDELQKSGTKLSALIISGHDGNGTFDGSMGTINSGRLKEVFEAHPSVAKDVRALYLWGCYTTNYGSCQSHWKGGLPNLSILLGYDQKGPLGTLPGGLTYLEDSLKKEKQFTEARDDEVLNGLFHEIRNIRQVNASICMGDKMIHNGGVVDRSQMTAACMDLVKTKAPLEWAKRIQCFVAGEKGCDNVPVDGDNDHGELRTIYKQVQGLSYCAKALSDSPDPDVKSTFSCWPDADHLLSLVKYRQVASLAQKIHGSDFADYDKNVESLKLPADAKLGDFSQVSRAQLNQRLAKAQLFADQKMGRLKDFASPDILRVDELALRAKQISHTFGELDKDCIDMSWPISTAKARSPCMKPFSADGVVDDTYNRFNDRLEAEVPKGDLSTEDYAAKLKAKQKQFVDDALRETPALSTSAFIQKLKAEVE